MGLLVSNTDFTGKYNIADATSGLNPSRLVSYIAAFEKRYIYLLLGATFGAEMIAYLTASQLPLNANLKAIIDPFAEDSTNFCGKPIYISAGLKEFLKAAIYYEYRNNGLVDSLAGIKKKDTETGIIVDPTSTLRYAEKMYNDMLDTSNAIQWKCSSNKTTYPNYKGTQLKIKASTYGL